MAFFELNEQLCKKDGICAQLCPARIIKINKDTQYPYIDAKDEVSCIECGQCSVFCPHFACEVQSIASENFDASLLPSATSTDILLRSRRSIRMFRKDLVPQRDLEDLLAVASMAPTATNKRNVHWLVISGREKLVAIADHVADYFTARSEAEGTQAIYGGLLAAYRNGQDIILRGASQLIIALTPNDWAWTEDGVIALTYLEIAAHSRNIGMCWAGFFTSAVRNYQPLKDYLGIKDDYVCGAQMTGYPILKAKKIPKRPAFQVEFR